LRKFENKDFVHLHCHSSYSNFDGLSSVEDLAHAARKMGFSALALTDHGNVSGWIKFMTECNATKDKDGKDLPYMTIKPLLGVELYLARYLHGDKDNQPDGKSGNRHIILIAKNWNGYKNLCTLSNISWMEGFYFSPRIDIDTLAKYSKDIFCSSACISGVVNANLAAGKFDQAKKASSIFKDIFGEDFALEVMYHGIPEQYKIIPSIMKLGSMLDIPVIATNDCHMINKEDSDTQEILMCMSMGTCIHNPKRIKHPYPEMYLKSAEEMGKIFGEYPQVLYNTKEIADRVNSKDIEKNLFSGMRLPAYKVPKEFKTPYEYLTHLAWNGLKKHGWHNSQPHIDALKMELEDVKVAWENNKYDFSTYFLIVADYIQYAKDKGILTGAGRGSGYASVLLRCLGITYGADPVKFSLLWQRFLGFKNSRFIKDEDFGFESEGQTSIEIDSDDEEEIEMDEE